MAEQLTRVESFPFDSSFNGYDSDGYPVYDRAVGATILRSVFEKFFSDGVFPSPGNALQIEKGESGLEVVVNPGSWIIGGAMGSIEDKIALTVSDSAPRGNVAYSVMLRYDNTESRRSMYFRVVAGSPATTPKPPAPDQTTPSVFEYRLGYVTVPSGATDLSSAVVTNEKGLAVCPYAAPFEEIDTDQVLQDFTNAARENYERFVETVEKYAGLLESSLDGSTAAYLQSQINELSAGMTDSEFLTYVLDQTVTV